MNNIKLTLSRPYSRDETLDVKVEFEASFKDEKTALEFQLKLGELILEFQTNGSAHV